MERGLRLTAHEIESLRSENPDVDWKLDVSDDPPTASLTLTLERGKEDIKAEKRHSRASPLTGILLLASVSVLLALPSGPVGDVAVIAAVVWPATLASVVYGLRNMKALRARYALRELLTERAPAETLPIDHSWVEPARSEDYSRAHLLEWMLAKWELADLELRINEGVQTQKKLSLTDPLRGTMQIEIETLRSRRDALRAGRQEHADRLDASAQRNLADKKRQAAEDEKRREYGKKLRAIEDEQQARLEAQERAQEWMERDS